MKKAILIDDEKPALQQLERQIVKDGRIRVEGKYTSVRAGLEHLRRERADIVFLDIGMPEINGLEAAEHIQSLDGGIRIVYVTAFSEYAIEAFELNALDYLLKPVTAQRLAKTVDRIASKDEEQAPVTEKRLSILCFRRLELFDPSAPGQKLKWRTNKSQELFALLLHQQGQWMMKDRILDLIWPDFGPDKAVANLHTTVYHIRKLLKSWGFTGAVEFSQERYRLVKGELLTDVERFIQGLSLEPIQDDEEWRRSEDILQLYRGDYLAEHDYDWADNRRKQLQLQYIRMGLRSAEYEQRSAKERQAVERLLRMQDIDPYSEDLCAAILQAYANLGDKTAMRLHYELYRKLMREELGVEPAVHLDRLLAHLSG